jgi:hypothetical protein
VKLTRLRMARVTNTLVVAEARITDEMRHRYAEGYRSDTVYSKIVAELALTPSSGRRPHVTRDNEVVVNASKPGNPFRLVDGLLYNRDAEGKERLVVPKDLIPDILQSTHHDKHQFARQRMWQDLDGVHSRHKRRLIDQYVLKGHQCSAQRQANQLPVGRYTPIQAPSGTHKHDHQGFHHRITSGTIRRHAIA